jgi:hypothetical protein
VTIPLFLPGSIELTRVIAGYIECALWSSTDNADDSGGSPLDDNYGPDDIADDFREQAERDCLAFCQANADDLADIECGQVGHDFWLTRNHHGAGFWDRGLGEPGERLAKAAHAYGSVDLYVGNDGLVHS